MEEFVGKIWHNYIVKRADVSYPEAVATLENQRKKIAVLFRALGGSQSVIIDGSVEFRVKKIRSILQKIAGTGDRVTLALQNQSCLQLPESISEYPDKQLNEWLYFWLSCLATTPTELILKPYERVKEILQIYPNLEPIYFKLVRAHIKVRNRYRLKAKAQLIEDQLQKVLLAPLDDHDFDLNQLVSYQLPAVILWIYPKIEQAFTNKERDNVEEVERKQNDQQRELKQKKQASYVDPKESRGGLLSFRLESLFSWTEFMNVDRPEDDKDDDDVVKIAEDLDQISLSRKNTKVSKGIKLDLDLPSEEQDFTPLETGILLPEWDYKKQQLLENNCSLTILENTTATGISLPPHLHQSSRHIKRQFEKIRINKQKIYRQKEGHDIDLLSHLQFVSDQMSGRVVKEPMLYNDIRTNNRDLACLLLADISLSTDAVIQNGVKVIDLIKDSLFLFADSLSLMQDRFAIYGFSSKYRDNIRYHKIKAFNEVYSEIILGRINDIKPDYYTRMGAAIRYSTKLIVKEKAQQKLLMILTDGKPNDLDKYEGKYGIEDTRKAILECKRAGVIPFCITIDDLAQTYLSHLFGRSYWVHIKSKESLPQKLTQLYAKLTDKV